jgi:hypothetical protein
MGDKSSQSHEKGNPQMIELLSGACPICFSDVKGNDEYLYFCKMCNLLFRRKHLRKIDEGKKN